MKKVTMHEYSAHFDRVRLFRTKIEDFYTCIQKIIALGYGVYTINEQWLCCHSVVNERSVALKES